MVYKVKAIDYKIPDTGIHILPGETLAHILSYLNVRDIISFSTVDKYHREFLDVLRHREGVYLSYNDELPSSQIFKLIRRVSFASKVGKKEMRLIRDLYAVKVTYLRCESLDLRQADKLHTIDLSCTPVSRILISDNVHTLDLSRSRITDVSEFGNVPVLNLSLNNVKDVSALGNVNCLDLSNTRVADVSALGNVRMLDLSYTKVTDVRALGNVDTLNLTGTRVIDVSALANVRHLDLSNTLVTDVSALANVDTLILYRAPVSDVSALVNVRILDISFTLVTDVSKLTNLETLYLGKSCIAVDISTVKTDECYKCSFRNDYTIVGLVVPV